MGESRKRSGWGRGRGKEREGKEVELVCPSFLLNTHVSQHGSRSLLFVILASFLGDVLDRRLGRSRSGQARRGSERVGGSLGNTVRFRGDVKGGGHAGGKHKPGVRMSVDVRERERGQREETYVRKRRKRGKGKVVVEERRKEGRALTVPTTLDTF